MLRSPEQPPGYVPPDMPEESEPAGNPEVNLIERLDKKIEMMTWFTEWLKDISSETDFYKIQHALDALEPEIQQRFPEAAAMADRIFQLRSQAINAEQELQSGRDHPAQDQERKNHLFDHLVSAIEEEAQIHEQKTDDVGFVLALRSCLNNLRQKEILLRTMIGETPGLVKAVNDSAKIQKLGLNLESSDVWKVRKTPFERTLLLNVPGSHKLRRNLRSGLDEYDGIHLEGTPLSVVSTLGKDYDLTVRHETVHNLLDEIEGVTPARYAVGSVLLINQAGQDRPSQTRQRAEAWLLNTNVPQLLDLLHNELLAGLEGLEQAKFKRPKSPVTVDRIRQKRWQCFLFLYRNYQYRGFDRARYCHWLSSLCGVPSQ